MKRRTPFAILLTALLLPLTPARALEPIESVTVDDGHLSVNGRPFFPIMLYGAKFDDASLAAFREHGFNMLAVHQPDHLEGMREKGFYAALGGRKAADAEQLKDVVLAIGMDSPALNWKDQMWEKLPPHIEQMHALRPGRPTMFAIGYWGPDDLEGLIAGATLGEDQYVKLIQAIDVAVPYLYPVPYQPISRVADAVQRAHDATGGVKPVLPVLQLFRWKADARYPTPDELRCMAYLSLMHGASGIVYYTYGSVTGEKGKVLPDVEPALWASVKQLNADIAAIGPVVLRAKTDDAARLASPATGVDFRALRNGEKRLILLANTTDAPQAVVLQLGANSGAVFKSMSDNVRINVDQLTITLQLKPFEAMALMN